MNIRLLNGSLFLALWMAIPLWSIPFNWTDSVSLVTLRTSWATWDTFFRQEIKPSNTYQEFLEAALCNSEYKLVSIDEFLKLNIENQRLNTYFHAKTAEEAYPVDDRPRGTQDIESISYLSTTNDPISPIIIVHCFDTQGKERFIKLDGAHRLIGAKIRNSPIKLLLIHL